MRSTISRTAFVLTAVFGIILTTVYAERMEIKDFESRKILYRFNEEVVLEGTLYNPTGKEKLVSAEVSVRKGMDRSFSIARKELLFEPGEEKIITFHWNPGTEEYGFAAFLRLSTSGGEEIAVSAPAIFEVCDDWRKVMRGGSRNITWPTFTPGHEKSSQANMDRVARRFRDSYVNTVEFFDVWHPRLNDLTPEEDVWQHWAHAIDHLAGGGGRWANSKIGKAEIKAWINRLQEEGIRVTSYFHVPDYVTPDESWRLYNRDGDRIHYYIYRPEYRRWLEENGYGIPNLLKFAEDFAERTAVSVREYNWDGTFLDDFNTVARNTASALTKDGQPVTDLSAAEVYDRALGKLLSRVRKEKGDFLFIPNGLHIDIEGIQFFPARDMFGAEGEKMPFIEAARHNAVNFTEVRAIQVQANSPWQFGRTYSAVRQASGLPVWGVFVTSVPSPHIDPFEGKAMPWTDKVETYKPFAAMILSTGLGYWDYYEGIFKNEVRDAYRAYNRFAARYGQYLYDLNIRWTERGIVRVDSPEHVYWKGHTYQREFSDYREVYVHLVNFDKHYLAARLWDEERTVPPPVRDIRVSVLLQPGEKVDWICYASADGDQDPVSLKVLQKDKWAEAIVPYLEYWDLIVARISKDSSVSAQGGNSKNSVEASVSCKRGKADTEIKALPVISVPGPVLTGDESASTIQIENPAYLEEGSLLLWFKPKKWTLESAIPIIGVGKKTGEGEWRGFNISMQPYAGQHLHMTFHPPDSNIVHRFAGRSFSMIHTRKLMETPDKWRQLAYTWRGENTKMFIDAVEIPLYPYPRPALEKTHTALPAADSVAIGGRVWPSGGINTLVERVSLYDVVLNREEILYSYEERTGSAIEQDVF